MGQMSAIAASAAHSPGFIAWMCERRVSFCLSARARGELYFIGVKAGRLYLFPSPAKGCGGVCFGGGSLYFSAFSQVWRLENVLPPGVEVRGHDAVFAPQVSWVTGRISIHDLATDGNGDLVFVNTAFSCLARNSKTRSFRPIWQPPFVTELVAEDLCHLNGLAMRDGQPAYVTALGATATPWGWRAGRADGGVLIDVAANAILTRGLSMPHSPRLHGGRLWMLNAGTGALCTVDPADGRLSDVAVFPGFPRGLAFVGEHAVVAVSKPRGTPEFRSLPLDDLLRRRGVGEAVCGLFIVDLKSGAIVHFLTVEGQFEEIQDIAVLDGVLSPVSVGVDAGDIGSIAVAETA